MTDSINLHYVVDGEDFTRAGEASADIKKKLKVMGVHHETVRKIAIAVYEGEINMVIHADGGTIDINISDTDVTMVLADRGPGIEDVERAMQAGYSTAPEDVRSLGFGAGMGLPNMKQNTDEMKVETELGKGTTVTMKVHLA